LFLEGVLRRELGDPAGAEACLLRLLQTPPGTYFASVDPSLRGYKARHNLALLYREQGRLTDAEAQWREAVADPPRFLPRSVELGGRDVAAAGWEDRGGVVPTG